MTLLNEILYVALTAAPWLLLGLCVAGLIKGFLPESVLTRWVGGTGMMGIVRAAFIGAPLPLCSCGAIPTALALHRKGAGRGPTTAFLIGTPGVGVDSMAITYALLGPFMLVARVAGAVATAIATGLLVAVVGRDNVVARQPHIVGGCCSAEAPIEEPREEEPLKKEPGGCCSSGCAAPKAQPVAPTPLSRLREGMHYAFNDVLDDISLWILAGLLVAGVLMAWVPPETIATHGSGVGIMLLMAVIGIPLYLCATAATPIAAGMLLSGVAPGAVLVFLLAGPITSMATLGVFRRELGGRALAAYLVGIMTMALLAGAVVNLVVAQWGLDLPEQVGVVQELLPPWLEWTALVLLVLVAIRPLRRMAVQRFA